MRVVAGSYGGRRLRAPRGRATRPTSDRVREALFSTIGARVVGAHVLDLFAGSGALGIEALSRGAADAVFVERDRDAAATLRANLTALDITATIHTVDAVRFVADLERDATPAFDLVLCDPPYTLPSAALVALLVGLAHRGRLHVDALLVAERARHGQAVKIADEQLRVADVRTYGDTMLYYIDRRPGGDATTGTST